MSYIQNLNIEIQDEFNHLNDNDLLQDRITECIKNLDMINFQLADLKLIKEKLERQLLSELNLVTYADNGQVTSVAHDGEKTHIIERYKLKIKTNKIYKLDKKAYELIEPKVSKDFNPVKKITTYKIDKSIMDKIDTYCSSDGKKMINSFIGFDYSKPSITIIPNV